MSKQGNFTKKILVDWISSECDRQLVNNLGHDNPQWLLNSEILPLKRQRHAVELKIGKDYESLVYNSLITSKIKTLYTKETNVITKTKVTPDLLNKLTSDLQKTKQILLLEHSFTNDQNYVKDIIFETNTLPFSNTFTEIIPDILSLEYFNPSDNENEIIMTSNGLYFQKLKSTKIGITIFDIKSTLPDNVGKHNFIEIIYYISALYYYLKNNNLTDTYFIRSDNHGILPSYIDIFQKIKDNTHPNIDSFSSLFELIILFQPIHYQNIFLTFLEKIRSFWSNAPLQKEKINPKITPICSRCTYFDDCKNTLGINYDSPETSNPSLFDIKLVPYVQEATVEQLKNNGIDSLTQLNEHIHKIKIQNTPSILYPEIPSLKLKLASLINKKVQLPNKGEFFSSTIPPYTNTSLIINLEKDPILQEVFAFSFNFSIFHYRTEVNSWFKTWAKYFNNKLTLNELILQFMQHHSGITDLEHFKNNMLDLVISDFAKSNDYQIIHRDNFLSNLKQYHDLLKELDVNNLNFIERKSKKTTYYSFSILDSFYSQYPHEEFDLLIELVEKITKILNFTLLHEILLRKLFPDIFFSFGIYYWSNEILKNFTELTEKYLTKLLTHPLTKHQIEFLIHWFSPSDSMVNNPIQHKKIFDIRSFVESSFGLPIIINYTWHEIYHELIDNNYKINSRFWNDNFNYMDHDRWHEILNDPLSKNKNYSMTQQLQFKVNAIDRIRKHFQNLSKDIFPNSANAISNEKFLKKHIPDDFNPIARIWYLFSKLSGTLQEFSSNQLVYDIPEFSIAKMNAGIISNLNIHPITGSKGAKRFYYTFELHGLSINMKISKNSWVRLIPFELRDNFNFLNYTFLTVSEKEWNNSKQCFLITTRSTSKNIIHDYETLVENNRTNRWFVYPKDSDNWTNKLYGMRKRNGQNEVNPESFLLKNNIGHSNLGFLASIKWSIVDPLYHNSLYETQFSVDLAEIYLFAPHLLNKFNQTKSNFISNTFPDPNESQKEAINNSLNQTISTILGPPGTGKSQTIAALLNEFLERSKNQTPNKPVRILISAFSYNAMFVIIDMLTNHQNNNGDPSSISKLDRYFITRNRNYDNSHSIIVDNKTIKLQLNNSDDEQTRLFTDNQTLEDHLPKDFIFFGNAHQLKKLAQLNKEETGMKAFKSNFGFDLIIIDEASQYPTDHILSILPFLYQNQYQVRVDKELNIQSPNLINDVEHQNHKFSKLILVGDHNQLPPVQPIKPPKRLENILGSIYSYYVSNHKINQVQLKMNYRSNEIINGITQNLGFYELIDTFNQNLGNSIIVDKSYNTPINSIIFDTNNPVISLIHHHEYDSTISIIESQIVVSLIMEYYRIIAPQNEMDFNDFWATKLGIVVPHNAQSNLIIQKIYAFLEKEIDYISNNELRNIISKSITSVEKFQGSARDLIICSIAISSKDQLRAEEEFIYDLNRYNVISSRAKKKFIFISSKNYLDFLPNDQNLMDNISIVRNITYKYLTQSSTIDLECEEHGFEKIDIRWKPFSIGNS